MATKNENIATKAMEAYDEVMYPNVAETPIEMMFSSMFIPITRKEYKALLAMKRVIFDNLPKKKE